MTRGDLSEPAPLSESHDLGAFDCGVASLNEWLKNRALKNERTGASRTYVVCCDERVIGYYCLSTGAVDHDDAPNPLRRNMPDPIPVLVLGRLAIDRRFQNRGFGHALLRDAIVRAAHAAEIVGAVALLVHALSESARRFYHSCGFIDFPTQQMTLCLMLRTAHRTGLLPVHN